MISKKSNITDGQLGLELCKYVPEIDSRPRNHPNWPKGPTKGLQSPEFADWDEWTRSCVTVNAAPTPVMKGLIEQNCTLPGQSETNDARQSDKLSQCLWKRDKTNSRAVDRFWSRISHSARCSLGCSFRFCHLKLIVWVKFSNSLILKRLPTISVHFRETFVWFTHYSQYLSLSSFQVQRISCCSPAIQASADGSPYYSVIISLVVLHLYLDNKLD